MGTVAGWLPERNYGWILGDDGQTYFAHVSEIVMTLRPILGTGLRVSFQATSTLRGHRATGIGPSTSYR